MRYGIGVTNVAEWIAIKLGKIPLPQLDTYVAPMQARALMVAVKAGVLDRLDRGPATADEVARELSLDAECLRLVLRVLRATGYVDLSGGNWSLAPNGKRYFGTSAGERYHSSVEYGCTAWDTIGKLEEVLATGKGVEVHERHDAREWAVYQDAMYENAQSFAWFVVDNMPVPRGAKACLDVAGAHGCVGAALCRKHPGLRSTVLDRAEALATAASIARKHGYEDVVAFREGDVRTDAFGEDVDVALLCNILHHFSAEQNVEILRRLRSAMREGGTVGIFDVETPVDDAPAEAASDAFALFFRITSSSTCFRGHEYVSFLEEAGFSRARIVRSVRMPSRVLVVAGV